METAGQVFKTTIQIVWNISDIVRDFVANERLRSSCLEECQRADDFSTIECQLYQVEIEFIENLACCSFCSCKNELNAKVSSSLKIENEINDVEICSEINDFLFQIGMKLFHRLRELFVVSIDKEEINVLFQVVESLPLHALKDGSSLNEKKTLEVVSV